MLGLNFFLGLRCYNSDCFPHQLHGRLFTNSATHIVHDFGNLLSYVFFLFISRLPVILDKPIIISVNTFSSSSQVLVMNLIFNFGKNIVYKFSSQILITHILFILIFCIHHKPFINLVYQIILLTYHSKVLNFCKICCFV